MNGTAIYTGLNLELSPVINTRIGHSHSGPLILMSASTFQKYMSMAGIQLTIGVTGLKFAGILKLIGECIFLQNFILCLITEA
jgi:hypothetical protein